MDKSFNDQELSDIMKEIEALEEDFTDTDEKVASPVMEELAYLEEEASVPITASKNVVSLESSRPAAKSASEASTSMSFKVHGQLTLELQFDIGGKVVCLEVTESGLNIEMEGGMKFTVPVGEKSVLKKAV
jgi:hypothetical protein